MEGYLLKKGRGDSNFGRRNWKKRWVVLEGSELKYYDDVDKNFQPVGLKGTTDVKGCEISAFDHKDKQFCFYVKPVTDSAISFQALDQKGFNAWMKAIQTASEEEDEPNMEDDYKLLGLSMDANPDIAEVNRAFRKAALRTHPDKGGDMAEFKRLQDAFNRITTAKEEEEEEKNYKYTTYTCVVTKNQGETGLGLIVVEDAVKKTIKIKSILPAVKAEDFSAEADGRMLVGDVLIGVGSESVERMPLARVGQKLSEARVPAGSRVKLTFRRRLHLDGRAVALEASASESASAVPASPDVVDIDETIRTFPDDDDDNDDDAGDGKDDGAPPTPTPTPTPAGPRPPASRASVGAVQLLSENEELQAELLLARDDVDTLRRALHTLHAEHAALQHAVQHQAAALAAARLRRQAYLPHLAGHGAGADRGPRLHPALRDVVHAVLAQQALDVPRDVEDEHLASELPLLHDADGAADAVRRAQRTAICAVARGDVSGKALQRWKLQGDSAAAKLRRFADKLDALALPTS